MFFIVISLLSIYTLAYSRASIRTWTLALGILLLIFSLTTGIAQYPLLLKMLWISFAIFAVIANIPTLRTVLITGHIFRAFKKVLPPMSNTEKEALNAGSVWWDGDLFSGDPQWEKLLKFPRTDLSQEEREFLNGPVETLCHQIDDWQINQELHDLPDEVWQTIKEQGFFGMIIPKKYGGLGFSASAHSAVVMKVASRSIATAVTVMVPNSLGPAELLLRYGTNEQKSHYLPRLARGKDIPCFALTSPEAGSDASSIPDFGIVCYGEHEGKQDVLGIRLTWDKRYITLGPVATVLGLAFQLRDPDHLLGLKDDIGITCALIPTNHPGVNIGRRHFTLGIAFQNGPNHGKDVFIPLDWVIGGKKQVGQGWRMLMECLATGRSISLPALSVGAAKFTSRTIGAYARVRKQFKTPIGYFEGIEEPLARMAGYTYMMDASRKLTASALDQGECPSVISAILKYNLTERMRQAVNDAMDIQGGSGICLGPHNILGKMYQAIPISITVEGANILTRSLIIYGQGAIRCHPYVFQEIEAAAEPNISQGVKKFDSLLWAHMGFVFFNATRASLLGLTNAAFANAPISGPTEQYYKQVTRFCHAFALASDIAMLILGGQLKRKEKLSGRLADILSLLYLTSATLKRYEDEGRLAADLPLVQWACEDNLYQIQTAFTGFIQNFPNRFFANVLKWTIFPLGRRIQPPNDKLGHQIARLLLAPSNARDRLTQGIFIPENQQEPVARLEQALTLVDKADAIEKRIRQSHKQGNIQGHTMVQLLESAVAIGIVTADECEYYQKYDNLRKEIIMVDDFDPEQFRTSLGAHNDTSQQASNK